MDFTYFRKINLFKMLQYYHTNLIYLLNYFIRCINNNHKSHNQLFTL